MASPVVPLYHIVFALMPANAEPLLPTADVYAYKICDRPCGPAFVIPARPGFVTIATAAKIRIVSDAASTLSMAIFTSKLSIFLPRYSGVRPTINPAMNTARMTKTSIP